MEYCIGIDEAGRGPLAGPVTAAAVLLPADFPVEQLKDSKKLTPKRREALRELIISRACWSVGWASHRTIDQLNIHYATLLAMERSFLGLACGDKWDIPMVIDGSYTLSIPHSAMEALPKADASVPAVMAASILAKTARDRWMRLAAERHPLWGFEIHKGYPTKDHREACQRQGLSPIHRTSFNITCRPSSSS